MGLSLLAWGGSLLWDREGKEISLDRNLFQYVYMVCCSYDGKQIIPVYVCHISAVINCVCVRVCRYLCVLSDARIIFVKVTGSLLPPQQQSEQGTRVCLSLLSVIVEQSRERERFVGVGWVQGGKPRKKHKENGFT